MVLTRLFYSTMIGICCTISLFPSAAPGSQSTLLPTKIPDESMEAQRDRYLGIIKRLQLSNTEQREAYEKGLKEIVQFHQEELKRVQQECRTELRELGPELEQIQRQERFLHTIGTMTLKQMHHQEVLLHKMDTINGVGYLGNALTFCVGMLDRITTSNTSFKQQILWHTMPLSLLSSGAFYWKVYNNRTAIAQHMLTPDITNHQFSVTYCLTYPGIAAAAYLLGFGCGTMVNRLTTRLTKK